MQKLILLFLIQCCSLLLTNIDARNIDKFIIDSSTNVNIHYSTDEEKVVKTSIDLLKKDFNNVLNCKLINVDKNDNQSPQIIIGTITTSGFIKQLIEKGILNLQESKLKKEGFSINVEMLDNKPTLIVVGKDKRGTAYGVMEISRLLGVSPLEWWADVTPNKLKRFSLPVGYADIQSPSVEYRGIFINDEDFGFMPWATNTIDKASSKGEVGPKAYSKVFELLLRMRANYIWPAMHSCTIPFYMVEGNKEAADKYGIYVGSSHCEPLNCNVNGEWSKRGKGEYNYIKNRESVLNFFEDRVKDIASYDNVYTIGMRGIHDGWMAGVNANPKTQAKILPSVFKDQRDIIQKYSKKPIEEIPQIFVPYKEVFDVYRTGLKVPDDVTLMWCNDSYGYILHLPTAEERSRKGGSGIYYHASYWYNQWLPARHPGLMFSEMTKAYDNGIQKVWILNVNDIKLDEYLINLFLDMAWNIDNVKQLQPNGHLAQWLSKNFGNEYSKKLPDLLWEYYRLNWIRSPEFVQARTNYPPEDKATADNGIRRRYLSTKILDTDFSKKQIETRLNDFARINKELAKISKDVPESKKTAFFELIEYPLKSAYEMNKKILLAQYARHGLMSWAESDSAHNKVMELIDKYDTLKNGKWKRIVGKIPWNSFSKIEHIKLDGNAFYKNDEDSVLLELQGMDSKSKLQKAWNLGYKGKAAVIRKGEKALFDFNLSNHPEVMVKVSTVPTHPGNGNKMRYKISLDNSPSVELNYWAKDGTQPWEKNVIRNQATRQTIQKLNSGKKHTISIEAVDADVLIDNIKILKLN